MLALLSIFFINASATPNSQGPSSGKVQAFTLETGETVNLYAIHFQGNQTISTGQLENLVKPFLNRPFAESDLYELKQRILLLYKSRGYFDASAKAFSEKDKHTITIVINEGKKSS